MQILVQDKNSFELMINSLEDLWVLSQFIVPNDRIFATTQRKVKIGNDKTKQVTKIIFVDLKVLKTSFESDILRVSGEIQNETEFTSIGQSQTLSFGVNDKIKIEKNSILEFEKKLLDRSVNSKKSMTLLILLDKDELLVSEFSDFTFKVFFHEKGLGQKKYVLDEINEEEQKLKLFEEFLKRDYENIIFAGPGRYKEVISKYVKDKFGIKSSIFPYSDVNSNSVSKVIKSISESGILKDNQVAKENELIEILLKNISNCEKNSYGFNNVVESVNLGSCDILLISTNLIDLMREDGTYLKLNELMRLVEQLNGSLIIINSKNEAGRILDGLGSIASINRY